MHSIIEDGFIQEGKFHKGQAVSVFTAMNPIYVNHIWKKFNTIWTNPE